MNAQFDQIKTQIGTIKSRVEARNAELKDLTPPSGSATGGKAI